jgi:hypothetical protein
MQAPRQSRSPLVVARSVAAVSARMCVCMRTCMYARRYGRWVEAPSVAAVSARKHACIRICMHVLMHAQSVGERQEGKSLSKYL